MVKKVPYQWLLHLESLCWLALKIELMIYVIAPVGVRQCCQPKKILDLSWAGERLGSAVFTILCFSANLTCLYMDEFLKHLVFCPLNGWSKIRPVHAQRWHRRWSTRFNGTTETTDCIGLKQTFSVYHHNFEHVLGHKTLNMERVLEFYFLRHLSREGISCCTQS